MATFNCFLTCSSRGCQEGKKYKVPLDKYSNDSNSLLIATEKKQFSFVCEKCYIINSINSDIAANKETIQILKTGKNLEEENMNLAKELKELEQKYKQSLEKLKKLKLQ